MNKSESNAIAWLERQSQINPDDYRRVLNTYCATCEAKPGEFCATMSGHRARWHVPRLGASRKTTASAPPEPLDSMKAYHEKWDPIVLEVLDEYIGEHIDGGYAEPEDDAELLADFATYLRIRQESTGPQ